MDGNQIKYRELLRQKLSSLENLYENIMLQEKALNDKKSKRLINLLDKSGKLIDIINKTSMQIDQMNSQCDYDEVSLKTSQLIKSKIEDIYIIYSQNYVKGKELKEEFRSSIKRVNLGKKAILGGYLKRQQQLYGYFVDKKVGKGCRY